MGTTVNGRVYDVAIKKGGSTYGFMLVPNQADTRRRASEAVPIIGVPGAQLEYAHDMWRPWTLRDFRGGLGQEEWEDPTKFDDMSAGIRIYRNRIGLDTAFLDEDASQNATDGVDFGGDHYAIVGTKIRKRTKSTDTWSEVHSSTSEFTDICVFGTKIYACAPGDTTYYSSNGTTWNELTALPARTSTQALLAFRGSLWACTNTKLRFSDDPLNSPWKPDNGIKIGDEKAHTWRLAVIGGIIAIGRTDGIYIYEGSGERAEGPVIDFENLTWLGNCKCFFVTDGFLYYNVGDRLKRTDLQGAEWDITPTWSGNVSKELYGFGSPVAGFGYQGHAYVAFDGMASNKPALLEMPTVDVGGWRLVYEGTGGNTMNGAWFSDGANRLLVNDGTTRVQRFQGYRDIPYPDYVTSAHIITSLFDAGDVWSDKLFGGLIVSARDCDATETIKIYYRKKGAGSWTLIKTISADGVTQCDFDPTNTLVKAQRIQLKVELNSSGGSDTPILELPLVVMYMVRAQAVHGSHIWIRAEDNLDTHDGDRSEWTAAQIKTFLRACEDYVPPLEYTDSEGTTRKVVAMQVNEWRNFTFTDLTGARETKDVMEVVLREVLTFA